MSKLVKIYELIDPRSGLPFYIGKTSRTLEIRLKEHLIDKYHCKRVAWIKYLLKNNVNIEIGLIDEVPEQDWQFWERHYISLYRSFGFDLKNDTEGGDGVKFSKEMVLKRVATLIGINIDNENNILIFESVSHAFKAGYGVSDCINGKLKQDNGYIWLKKEDYENISREDLLKKIKDAHYHSGSVIINKIDKNGNIVQQYPSMRSAANDNGLEEHLIRTSHKYNLFRGDFKYIRV